MISFSIVAVSTQLFDNWPTWNGLNPNENPICGQHLEITCESISHPPPPFYTKSSRLLHDSSPFLDFLYLFACTRADKAFSRLGGGKSLIVEVADSCPGCDIRSLDMSIGVFEHFAGLDVGLLGMDSYTGNISWSWVEGSGPLAQVPVS